MSADLTSSHLTSADLTSPHLIMPTDLASSYLTSADLTSSHLTSAHLTSSHLMSTDLTSSYLTSVDLTSSLSFSSLFSLSLSLSLSLSISLSLSFLSSANFKTNFSSLLRRGRWPRAMRLLRSLRTEEWGPIVKNCAFLMRLPWPLYARNEGRSSLTEKNCVLGRLPRLLRAKWGSMVDTEEKMCFWCVCSNLYARNECRSFKKIDRENCDFDAPRATFTRDRQICV